MKHRGKHSNDDKNFAAKWHPVFAEAASDLSFLLGRSYGEKSALALVGNRYRLNKRQQRALMLLTSPADKIESRIQKRMAVSDLKGKDIIIDGYNLLILVEVALSGGYIFKGQDECYRDIASVHGTYKKVEETRPALNLIDEAIKELGIQHAHWYFDSPVSNSGRLKALIYELAETNQSNWDVDLVFNPDTTLIEKGGISVTCDSWIIDEVTQCFDLARYVIDHKVPDANVLDFFGERD